MLIQYGLGQPAAAASLSDEPLRIIRHHFMYLAQRGNEYEACYQ